MTPLADIDQSIEIDAPQARVWQALTEAGLVEQWLGCIGFRPEPGALFYMQPDPAKRAAGDISGSTHCELEALEPPRLMSFTWFMPGTPKTLVCIELVPAGETRTVARLVHSGWERFDPEDVRAVRDMLDGGWSSFVLPGLKRISEQG